MKLVDVTWGDPVNILTVECCGEQFRRPSNYSRVRCPRCNKIELWHRVQPTKPGSGFFDDPVMEQPTSPLTSVVS
jgi:hypothetical protein